MKIVSKCQIYYHYECAKKYFIIHSIRSSSIFFARYLFMLARYNHPAGSYLSRMTSVIWCAHMTIMYTSSEQNDERKKRSFHWHFTKNSSKTMFHAILTVQHFTIRPDHLRIILLVRNRWFDLAYRNEYLQCRIVSIQKYCEFGK